MIHTVTLNPSLDRTLHYDRLQLGAVNRASSVRVEPSGKGVNVAAALRSLGQEATILLCAGGATGRALIDDLEAQGYKPICVTVAEETRSNVTVIDDASGVITKLNEAGAAVTIDDLAALERLLLERATAGDWCVLSGSLPPGAPSDTYAQLITVLHAAGVWTALDTSGEALVLGAQAGPDLCKPNEQEARELAGPAAPSDVPALARAIQQMGPRRVLLTTGAQGGLWADDEGLWQAESPAIAAVNPVGAGDAALAGAVYALQAGQAPQECLRWAVAVGSAKAAADGSTYLRHATAIDNLRSIALRRLS